MTSILRWSGSKAKLIPLLSSLAPSKFDRYVEPFAGSASLYFAAQPTAAVLGDRNPEVIDVYRAIRADPLEVANALDSIPQTRDAFYTLRALEPERLDLPKRAARLIFLMKACFNGVYRTNRQGRFNVPMGNRIYALPSRERLMQASRLLQGAELVTGDFLETVDRAKRGDWVYMDPPYKATGRYRGEYGYARRFDESDLHRFFAVASELSNRGCYVAISHQADEQIIEYFKDWTQRSMQARRTVAGHGAARQRVTELIFTNY